MKFNATIVKSLVALDFKFGRGKQNKNGEKKPNIVQDDDFGKDHVLLVATSKR